MSQGHFHFPLSHYPSIYGVSYRTIFRWAEKDYPLDDEAATRALVASQKNSARPPTHENARRRPPNVTDGGATGNAQRAFHTSTARLGYAAYGDCFWYAVEAVYNGYSALIDWGMAATFEDLALVGQRQYKVRGTDDYVGIYKALIDAAGNRTQLVYEFCLRSGNRSVPLMGRTAAQGLFSPVRESTAHFKGYPLPLPLIDDKTFKDTLYLSIIKEQAGKLYFPTDTDDDLKQQLSSERLAEKKQSNSTIKTEWICTNKRNHLGDCCKYLEAFKYRLEPLLNDKRRLEAQGEQPKW